QRHLELVRAVDAEQARDAALDRDRRLAGDLLAHVVGDPPRRLAAGRDHARVEAELGLHALLAGAPVLAHRSSLTIGKGMTSRSVSRSVRIMTRRSTPMPPPAVGE